MLKHLFSSIKIGSAELRNRIVMPPMSTGYGAADGSVTERHINYYEARAKGGAGLIVVEVTTPNAVRKYGGPVTLGKQKAEPKPCLCRILTKLNYLFITPLLPSRLTQGRYPLPISFARSCHPSIFLF